MRGFIKVVAGIAIAVSSIAIVTGLVGIFTQNGKEQTQAAALLGCGLAGILFSGMAWILVDVANAVAPEQPATDVPATYVPVVVTPAVLDGFRQRLCELPDAELNRLSHNTSRGLPAYKAIMDEMDKRKTQSR